jgi:CBS domain-containing protein
MHSSTHQLSNLAAQDIMSSPVTLIAKEMSLKTAARLLRQANVSGAPVVDAEGRCVGVVSAVDFLIHASGEDWPDRRLHGSRGCPHSAWEILESQSAPDLTVEKVMTSDPVTVAPRTPITQIAQAMVDAHIHRVVVVDETNRPRGIVSSTDILAVVARCTQSEARAG